MWVDPKKYAGVAAGPRVTGELVTAILKGESDYPMNQFTIMCDNFPFQFAAHPVHRFIPNTENSRGRCARCCSKKNHTIHTLTK